MGCGRVGSYLARNLEDAGHSVAVVDRDEAAFRRLPSSFEGRRVVGIGFDRDTLVAAGIEQAYAFAAVSSGDNSNILAARVARETYGVDHVVARIYDPGRAEIYERLGIPTVATVRWAADQVMRRLVPQQAEPDPDFPTVSFPNPEEPGAIDLALDLAREVEADVVIALDTDADRCSVATRGRDGAWRQLSGDEIGAILGQQAAADPTRAGPHPSRTSRRRSSASATSAR